MVHQYDNLLSNKRHWVLVADASRARILEADSVGGPLRDILTIDHPQGRLRERDMVSDREGRSFDSKGSGRHALGNPERGLDAENEDFARQLLKQLHSSWQTNKFEALSIVASPKFLGTLNQLLDPQLAKIVVTKSAKSMVSADCETICALLREELPF